MTMSSKDDFIALTLRLENASYHKFHETTSDRGVDKTWVLRKLVELYNETPSIIHHLEGAKRRARSAV